MKDDFISWGDSRPVLDLETGQNAVGSALLAEPLWKSVLDKSFAVAALLFLAPFIAVLCLLLKFREGGPVFFAHTRIGKNGEPFKCLKFRTMLPDAEARLAAHLDAHPEVRTEWEARHKLSDDPRITCLGHFLRKTSLDELPQFWNVLRGDMSIVGPRPITRDEARHYGKDFKAYLSVRPGITGLWQVSGRSDTTYAERVAMDVDYVKTRSLLGDCRIILKTVAVVMSQSGAR